ncbi:MAG: folate family ECF transporter S component [Eubacteriales bacterium]|nr:folate family ECF transporter S component [Eubacteriales bacterium]
MIQKQRSASISTKTLVILALLTGMSFILEKYLGISSPLFKLHFGYIPIALSGMLFGLPGALLTGVTADILSNIQYFNIIWVLLAALEAAVFALFLHPESKDQKQMLRRALLCQLTVSLVIQAGLNTLLLWLMYRSFNPIRFVSNALTFPFKTASLYFLLKYRKQLERFVA